MLHRHKTSMLLALIALTLAVACKKLPDEAYFNRGTPESLLDFSSEVVNLPISNAVQLNEFSSWVNRDQPTRAELYCSSGNFECDEAKQVLDLYGVSHTHIPSEQATVTLVYERVLSRDCEQRFIDNRNNFYNLNHPTFGCSVAANIVQQASDKKQFLSPNRTDPLDAQQAVRTYQRYLNAEPGNASGQGQGGGGAGQFGGGNFGGPGNDGTSFGGAQ